MSTPSPIQALAALLLEARDLEAQPLALRTSNKLLLISRLIPACQAALDFLQGFEQEHQLLVSKVELLLAALTPPYPTNGSLPDWMSEVGPGKAPAVRKARAELIKLLKGEP